MKYKHAEAFCLMHYKCEKCGNIEILWNSRDGVTPFIISCTCGGQMFHIMWQFDKCVPDFKPEKGQRIFVDMTKEHAEKIAKEIVERCKGSRYKLSQDDLKSLAEDIYGDGHQPCVIVYGQGGTHYEPF